jgi:hypothetical protein
LAAAEDHQGQSSISAPALGSVDALLNFCLQVDPRDAASFRAQRSLIEHGSSEDTIEHLRGSSAYRQSYDLVSDALKGVAKSDAAQACAAGAR